MSRIRARMESLPADWVKVEAWLPASYAQRVLDLATMLKASCVLPAGVDMDALKRISLGFE